MSQLRSCEACGHDIAKGARTCPHCGKRYTTASGVILAVLIALLLAGGCTFYVRG